MQSESSDLTSRAELAEGQLVQLRQTAGEATEMGAKMRLERDKMEKQLIVEYRLREEVADQSQKVQEALAKANAEVKRLTRELKEQGLEYESYRKTTSEEASELKADRLRLKETYRLLKVGRAHCRDMLKMSADARNKIEEESVRQRLTATKESLQDEKEEKERIKHELTVTIEELKKEV